MENTEAQISSKRRLFGPWVVMVILPWLFPFVLIFMLMLAAINESIEPLKKAHYWLLSSLIGLTAYAGLDFWLGIRMQQIIGSYNG